MKEMIKNNYALLIICAISILIVAVSVGYLLFGQQSSNQTIRKAEKLQTKISVDAEDGQYEDYKKPSDKKLKNMLSEIEFSVTQEGGTEEPFENELFDKKEKGIYVDILSGEPLFSSRDKYESGTGWPTFTQPVDPSYIVLGKDSNFGLVRVAVKSKYGENHIGHIFDDGPTTKAASGGAKPTGLRYCMNSASLRFVPEAELEKEGLGAYKSSL